MIDFQERLASIQAKNAPATHQGLIWKPKQGQDVVIRPVPLKTNAEDPFQTLYFHYNLTNRALLSPKSYGSYDPISFWAQKELSELARTGKRVSKQKYALLAKAANPTPRHFMPIVLPSGQFAYWDMNDYLYQRVLEIVVDYGNIWDLKTGRALHITHYIPAGDKKYGHIEVQPLDSEAIFEEYPEADANAFIRANQKDLKSNFPRSTEAELEAVIENNIKTGPVWRDAQFDTFAPPLRTAAPAADGFEWGEE